MRVLLAFLLFVLPQAFESDRHSLDLEPLLQDPAALQGLTVVYQPPIHQGWAQLFFVRGDGSLILQAYPDRPMAVTDVPTCRAKVSQDVVKDLVRSIIQRHFFELPERQFISMRHKVTRNWNCTLSQLTTVGRRRAGHLALASSQEKRKKYLLIFR